MTLLRPTAADDSFLIAGDSKTSVAVLESDAPTYEKAKACQRLAIVGDTSALKSLMALVDHPQLSSYALTALGLIPGEQADSAIINAIDPLAGRPLIGLLHVIGQRQLKSAIPAIRARMMSGALDDAEMQAAIRSLAAIGTVDALRAVGEVTLSDPSSVTRLLQADASRVLMMSKETARPLALEDLNADDSQFRHALTTARQLGPSASTQLTKQLPALSPSRQALVLICLADLGSRDAVEPSRALIDSDDAEVAVRAVEAVAKLGGFSDAIQLPAFVGSRPELASRFMTALASVANQSIDQDVVQLIATTAEGDRSDRSEMRIALMQYAALRRLSSATPSLLKLSFSDDPLMRTAAFEAAGMTVNLKQFPSLIGRVIDQRVDRSVAVETLQRACVHLPQYAAAETIAEAFKNVDRETRLMLMNQLAFLGGPRALEIVTDLAASGDDGAIDAATQVLGTWTTADVAAPLLRLADDLPQGKFRLRALRGYLRVGRQLDMPSEARLELCKNGFERAERDDERILVLEILRRFPSKAGFVWLAQLLQGDSWGNRQVTNRAFTTLAHVASRVANEDAATVSQELAKIDLSKSPAAVRSTLEALRTSTDD